jgi:probable dihydroxyacetone kinase regulator
MSNSLITKNALVFSIKALMDVTPLSKISVQDIANHCGVSRKTFYYHFKDKFDLVNWIYSTEVKANIADCNDYEHWTIGANRTLNYLMMNKSFYINAFNTPGQNSFDEYFYQFCSEIVMNVINNLSADMTISNTDKTFIADFYAHAFLGIAMQWIKHGMKKSPSELVEALQNVIEGSMPHALSKFSK